jgi:hypothetical protein
MNRSRVVTSLVAVGLLLSFGRHACVAQSTECEGSILPRLGVITDQVTNPPPDWVGDPHMMALLHHQADAEDRVIALLRPRLITYCIITDPSVLQAPTKNRRQRGVVVLDFRARGTAGAMQPVALSIMVRRVLGTRPDQNLFVDERIFLIQSENDYARIATSADLLVSEGMSTTLRKKGK